MINIRMQTSRFCAHYACFFEEYIACELNETQAFINTNEMRKVAADEHTLISYLKHRIPCKCLDEKYKQVKSTKKMGFCYNKDCCHPNGLVERSSLLTALDVYLQTIVPENAKRLTGQGIRRRNAMELPRRSPDLTPSNQI